MAMTRFSFCGHFIVAAIVLTGAVNIALTSGRPPIPPDTPYRALLDAKIVVVAIMILLAVFNRYVLAPRLKLGARALRGSALDQRGGGRARLRRGRPCERFRAPRSGLSLAVLLVRRLAAATEWSSFAARSTLRTWTRGGSRKFYPSPSRGCLLAQVRMWSYAEGPPRDEKRCAFPTLVASHRGRRPRPDRHQLAEVPEARQPHI